MKSCMKDDLVCALHTSWFGNIENILASVPDARFVSIAGQTPSGFNGQKFKPLMPHYSWWKEWHDKFSNDLECKESREWYISKYTKTVLSTIDQLEVARQLKDLCGWHPTFLLCYETPEKFCHRHIVVDWFSQHGILCKEWKE